MSRSEPVLSNKTRLLIEIHGLSHDGRGVGGLPDTRALAMLAGTGVLMHGLYTAMLRAPPEYHRKITIFINHFNVGLPLLP